MADKNLSQDKRYIYFNTDLSAARILSEPNCQNRANCWYLVFRWLLFFCWISIVIYSIIKFANKDLKGHGELWLIYFTHWDLIFGVSQSLLGAIIVTKRWKLQMTPYFEPNEMKLGKLERIYWFLYVVTSTLATGVTIMYWVAVYNPKTYKVNALNIFSHVCNSVLMLTDMFVSNVPFSIRNAWWSPIVMLVYLIFNFIYFLADGLDEYGNRCIYEVLDWKKPQKALPICFGVLIFVVMLHYLLHLLLLFRDYAYEKICICVDRAYITRQYRDDIYLNP